MRTRKILFISHDAHRTGAPILLLNLLRHLKIAFPTLECKVLLKYGGDMENDFREEFPHTLLFHYPFYRWSVIGKAIRALHAWWVMRQIEKYKPDLIFANTVVSSDVVIALKKRLPHVPVILHVHELQMSIERFIGEKVFREALPFVDWVIGASEKVNENLRHRYKIPNDRLTKIYEYIPIKDYPLRTAHSLNFKIVACGTLDWRKSPQLFVQIAGMVHRRLALGTHNIRFVWVGGNLSSMEYRELQYDLERLGLEQEVIFTGSIPNPSVEFVTSDLFLLTSREDPYPLVCLEAASAGVPILCFQDSGGMPEFVEEDAGWIMPYLDCESMADCIVEQYFNREEALSRGKRAQQKVKERHTLENAATLIAEEILRLV
jgi:glycosyltransferase involved in cell wall biosynthesis